MHAIYVNIFPDSCNGSGVDCTQSSVQPSMVIDKSVVNKNSGFVKLSSSGAPLRNSTLAVSGTMTVNNSNASGSVASVSLAKSRERSLSVPFGANSSAIVGGFEPLNLAKCLTSHSLSPMPVLNSTLQNVVVNPPPKQVIQPAMQKRVSSSVKRPLFFVGHIFQSWVCLLLFVRARRATWPDALWKCQ